MGHAKKINEKFSNSRKFLNNPCARNMWGIVVIDDIGNLLNGPINNQIWVKLTVNMTLLFKYVQNIVDYFVSFDFN